MLSPEEIKILVSVPRLTYALFRERNLTSPQTEEDIIEIWQTIRSRLPSVSSFPREKNEELICYGVFVTEEYGGQALPLNSRYFEGDIGIFYNRVKDFLNRNKEATMVDVVAIDTLRTIFLDDRFLLNPLRRGGDLSQAHFSIDLLEKEFEVSPDQFWNVYEPCQMGITLHYQGHQATFLPSVMRRWLSDCQVSNREDFEREVFSALFEKMGLEVPWWRWKEGTIHLYRGYEYKENNVGNRYFFY